MVPANRGKPPEAPKAPPGPTVQESSGRAAPVRTFQDLLQNQHDEDLFEYYATSQLAYVIAESREVAPSLGSSAIYADPICAERCDLLRHLRRFQTHHRIRSHIETERDNDR